MELVDTHCHIQFSDYQLNTESVIADAVNDDVTRLMSVGCTLEDSLAAIDLASKHDNIWATIGLHPHEAKQYINNSDALGRFSDLATQPKVVAIGEAGLDYYYHHSPVEDQIKLLKFQLDLASQHDLPMIFHVREAFDDFWQILKDYPDVRGVVHSFSVSPKELDRVLSHNLLVGLNGIMTFTKDPAQIEAAKAVPLDKLLIETDAPFLTPVPFRGTICQPKHARVVARFLADLRGISLDRLANVTTSNAIKLFNLK